MIVFVSNCSLQTGNEIYRLDKIKDLKKSSSPKPPSYPCVTRGYRTEESLTNHVHYFFVFSDGFETFQRAFGLQRLGVNLTKLPYRIGKRKRRIANNKTRIAIYAGPR